MKRIIAFIQARFGSTRLPGKVLLKVRDKTILEHVIERVKRSRLIEEVAVITTILKDDLKIVSLCVKNDVSVYCGSQDDVLDRYFQAARLFGARHIVRITADCPLIDAKIIDRVIKLHLSEKADYTSNILKETFPDGEDVEAMTFKALKEAWQNARLSSEREHVSVYIKKHPRLFKLVNLNCKENLSRKRWTIDEKEDYRFIKVIYANLYKKNRIFGMDEIIELLKKHPEYEMINSRIKRNEGYLKSLKKDKIVNLEY